MNKQLIKISVIVIGALVLLVLALYLMKKDQDRPGKRNSVETIGEAIADKTFTTKSEAYMAYANEKDEFYRRSAASFAPPPAVSKEPEAEKAAAAASAAPAVENRTQEIRFERRTKRSPGMSGAYTRKRLTIHGRWHGSSRKLRRSRHPLRTCRRLRPRRPKNDVGGPCARTGVWAALPRQPGAIPHGLRCSGP